MKTVYDGVGKSISLGAEIARGGEGVIYAVSNSPQKLVAKLYLEDLSADKREKLTVMARIRTDNLARSAAWPISTLHAKPHTPVVGMLMPKIEDSKEIHSLYGVKPRRQNFPKADWEFLILAARNLAASVARIHKEGHVIGDLNQRNIFVAQNALVRLIDADSFQIQVGKKIYFCDVGTLEFTPPELQGKSLPNLVRTQNHDNFGLALMIFHLLFMGRHPFSGRFLGAGDMSIDRAIREFRFAYSEDAARHKIAPPPDTVGMQTLPSQIARMFEVAFGHKSVFGGRPTAQEWLNILDAFRSELIVCPHSSSHKFYRGLTTCPWCKLEADTGVTFFPVAAPPTADIEIDIGLLWQRILGVNPPPSAPIPDYRFAPTAALPLPDDLGDPHSRRYLEELKREVARRRQRHSNARHEHDKLVQRWRNQSSNQEFGRYRDELAGVHKTLLKHHQKFEEDKRLLAQDSRASQLQQHLDSFTIDAAIIPHVGEVRKISLQSYGIETAADVSYQRALAVPGIGETIALSLVSWRNLVLQPRFSE